MLRCPCIAGLRCVRIPTFGCTLCEAHFYDVRAMPPAYNIKGRARARLPGGCEPLNTAAFMHALHWTVSTRSNSSRSAPSAKTCCVFWGLSGCGAWCLGRHAGLTGGCKAGHHHSMHACFALDSLHTLLQLARGAEHKVLRVSGRAKRHMQSGSSGGAAGARRGPPRGHRRAQQRTTRFARQGANERNTQVVTARGVAKA
jgi:hypothetical protein